jgi:hypothetical protein
MACCALRKRKKQLMILPVALFLLVGAFGGLLIGILTMGSLFSRRIAAKRNKTLNTFKQLENGLIDKILNEPFLFDAATRCKVSGRLMNFSSSLAGAVYKYFNLIVFGTLILTFFLLIEGLTVLKI